MARRAVGSRDQARAVLLGLSLIMLAGFAVCLSGVRMTTGHSSRAATVAALVLFAAGCAVLGFVLAEVYAT